MSAEEKVLNDTDGEGGVIEGDCEDRNESLDTSTEGGGGRKAPTQANPEPKEPREQARSEHGTGSPQGRRQRTPKGRKPREGKDGGTGRKHYTMEP